MIGHAISTVKLKDIQDWSDLEIGLSVQSERKKIRRCVANIKDILDTKPSGVLEKKIMGF